MRQNTWFIGKPNMQAQLRLYCFPYAGGSAAVFRDWQQALGPSIEVQAVQLPGRGNRFCEPACSDIAALVDVLAREIASQPRRPFAFFGHSMGALLAFETARRLARLGGPQPMLLFASGCAAPQARGPRRDFNSLDDAGLVAELRECNGTPPEIFEQSELLEMLLPMIRADFHLAWNYQYVAGTPLTAPIVVLAGRDDDRIDAVQVEAWGRETSNRTHVHWIDGGHFFIDTQRETVLECVKPYLLTVHSFANRPVYEQLKQTA